MATDKLTILMIDDDAEDIAIVRSMLERVPVWSVELLECLDVNQAVAQVQHRKPDLILLDFNFGIASGLEILPSLRSCGYAGPIILLSGCGNDEIASMIIAGLSDFLSKNALSSLTLYHAITLAMAKQHVPVQRADTVSVTAAPDPIRRTPSAKSSSPPRVRYQ